ncbi:MAG: hypothetical protein OXN17_11080 [Candidatus Poribacteria bacterium]|nr:hypothetical protein [Candidatus Poribacteria bacterium]
MITLIACGKLPVMIRLDRHLEVTRIQERNQVFGKKLGILFPSRNQVFKKKLDFDIH